MIVLPESLGNSEYGGSSPGNLCAFVAFMSSERHGDSSPGGDRDPRLDSRVQNWRPRPTVVQLSARWPLPDDPDDEEDSRHVSHTEVPAKILAEFGAALAPGCQCVTAP